MEAADFSLGPMEAARRRSALRLAGIAPEGFEGRAMGCELCGRLLAALGYEKWCEGAASGRCNAVAGGVLVRIAELIDPAPVDAVDVETDVGTAFGADEHIGWACPECGCGGLEDGFRYCPRCGVPVDFYGDRR